MKPPFTREELYNHVWSKPISKLEKELNLSNWDIKQWCKKLEVPLPPVGHWTRLQFGKPVEQIPLPPLSETAEKALAVAEADPPDLAASRQVHAPPILFPGETELSFAVPDRLINPDKLTLAAEHTLRSRITKPNPEFGTVHTELEQLNIRVSPGNINRALRIMDVLVKAWKRRGYRIGFEGRDMFVYIRTKVKQRVHLWEITTKRPKEKLHGFQLYDATGKLAFKMEYVLGREWRDGKQFLEDQILDILNQMELAARYLEKSWADQAERDVQREGARAESIVSLETEIIERQRPKNPKKKKGFKKLLKEAKRWKERQLVDEYLADQFLNGEHTTEFLEWIEWARKVRIAK
ncbi:hypothetical protein ACFQZX_00450 [Mucilaginibacter litoreus]|uniref:Initiator Replication protein n=1 Tax=Mucilaginibacter litoreus TaxID=1048221 RepID=A0ABW3AN10_9SPHI